MLELLFIAIIMFTSACLEESDNRPRMSYTQEDMDVFEMYDLMLINFNRQENGKKD